MMEYYGIKVHKDVKKEFDRQRSLPQGRVTADDFLKYLLDLNKPSKKR